MLGNQVAVHSVNSISKTTSRTATHQKMLSIQRRNKTKLGIENERKGMRHMERSVYKRESRDKAVNA